MQQRKIGNDLKEQRRESQMEKEKLQELLQDMSLKEKISQMFQLNANFFMDDAVLTGPLQELGIAQEDVNQCGNVLGVYGAKKVKAVIDKQMENQEHHIPPLIMQDVINGYKTIFPIPLAQGCTFNPALIKKGAAISARESAVSGVQLTFAPMVDLVRDSRWGRVMESTGEDKYLNSRFAKAFVEGFQGNDLTDTEHVGACIKHFAGYGLPDAGRDYNNVEVSQRTFMDDMLPAYEAGIKAGAVTVMTSFNTINRIPASGNKWLLRDILRQKMGFKGVLISDWQSIWEMTSQGNAENEKDAARLAVKAGVDIDMMSNCYVKNLEELVLEGTVSEEIIDEAVYRILELKNKLGLFENPYKGADEEKEADIILCNEHRNAAREMAAESFVLLENDGILPLSASDESIAFIGPFANCKEIHGAWSMIASAKDNISIKEAVQDAYPNGTFYFENGCNHIEDGAKISGFGSVVTDFFTPEEEEEAQVRAIEAAAKADKVVMTIGEHRLQSGEAASYGDIKIPSIQMELFRRIYEVNRNIVVVLFNGRPLDIRELKDKSKAILDVWFPGTEGGNAIADVLFGKKSPSGKLSMSFPFCVGQVPIHYDCFSTGRPLSAYKDQPTRFCSQYVDIPNEPLYPFGYGLSYTTFEYSNLAISSDTMTKSEEIMVSVDITNKGDYIAKETVQMYIQDVKGSVVRPVRELKGFQKLALKPEETVTVTFTIDESMLRFYDGDMNYTSEPGLFRVYVGQDSSCKEMVTFTLR